MYKINKTAVGTPVGVPKSLVVPWNTILPRHLGTRHGQKIFSVRARENLSKLKNKIKKVLVNLNKKRQIRREINNFSRR